MPVHNALPFLDEAIASILNQTFADFEFVILDDASTDGSTERLREWAAKDGRIRFLQVKRNLGPALSSDRVARAASAPVVARMDADDISLPLRLAEQLDVLERHPETGLVASLSDLIDADGRKLRGPELWRLARTSPMVPFAHGTIMYRQEVFERAGGYRKECEFWEDQDLILRMSAIAPVVVIPRSLYQVRQSSASTRQSADQERQEQSLDSMYRSLDQRSGDGRVLVSGFIPDEKVDPRVFVTLGSVALWGGGRPRLFRRLLRRGRLSMNSHSLAAMAWTAWAAASPRTLRAFLSLLLSVRNRLASARVGRGGPVSWSPQGAVAAPPDRV